MPKSRTLGVPDCAERYRAALDELAYARAELEHAITAAGWQELLRHSGVGEDHVVYQRRLDTIDPVTGWSAEDAEVANFQSFVDGSAPS